MSRGLTGKDSTVEALVDVTIVTGGDVGVTAGEPVLQFGLKQASV